MAIVYMIGALSMQSSVLRRKVQEVKQEFPAGTTTLFVCIFDRLGLLVSSVTEN